MNITIAAFTIEAYERVYSLWDTCDGIGLSTADSRDNIQVYLDRNPGMSLLARDENNIVGAILCGHDGRRGYIHHLAVHPQYRRQGLARQLVDRSLMVKYRHVKQCLQQEHNDAEYCPAFWLPLAREANHETMTNTRCQIAR